MSGSFCRRYGALVLLASCQSVGPNGETLHQHGERMITVRGIYGQPIRGKAILWYGKGDAPEAGLGLAHHWFVDDRFAFGAGLNVTRFAPIGDPAWGFEVEAGGRGYMLASPAAGLFVEAKGGYVRTGSPIPLGGTRDNYTFAFGPGAEVPLTGKLSLLGGVEFHHMSNAKGRDSPRNPSQNETRGWIGFGIHW